MPISAHLLEYGKVLPLRTLLAALSKFVAAVCKEAKASRLQKDVPSFVRAAKSVRIAKGFLYSRKRPPVGTSDVTEKNYLLLRT